jgi:hypothetical protein
MIVIPSYNRYKYMKTIQTLHKHGIPIDSITIYVIQEEYNEYKKEFPDYNIVVGVKGLVPQRQFIMDQYPEGTPLVFMDDDLDEIDLSMTTFTLQEFIKHAFQQCTEQKAYLWGVYPCYNPFFRKARSEMDTCLNFIVGCFYGVIVRKNPNLDIILCHHGNKEDVERSIRYFIEDGIVLRFNKVAPKTKYYGSVGGLGTMKDRMESMQIESNRIQNTFPEHGKIKVRKNGIHEFVLKKIKRIPKNTLYLHGEYSNAPTHVH